MSLLFPVAAPLFACFFFGVAVKESNIGRYGNSWTSFCLVLLVSLDSPGSLAKCDHRHEPQGLPDFSPGDGRMLLSGIGGLIAGLIAYKVSGGKINPLIALQQFPVFQRLLRWPSIALWRWTRPF